MKVEHRGNEEGTPGEYGENTGKIQGEHRRNEEEHRGNKGGTQEK